MLRRELAGERHEHGARRPGGRAAGELRSSPGRGIRARPEIVAAIDAALATGDDLWSDSEDASRARERLARRATAWSASAVLMPLAGELAPDHAALADEVLVTTTDGELR